MQDIIRRLTSRKFLLAVGSLVGIVTAAYSGQIDTMQTVLAAVGVVGAYLGVQGLADYRAVSINKPPLPFTGAQTETGATIAGEIAPGVPLEITVGEGQKPAVTLAGKPLDKLQLKDVLPILARLKF